MIQVQVYRYNPEVDNQPRMKSYQVEDSFRQWMVLDVLEHLKEHDSSLTYRRSCREGVCGSDGMNINGQNALACVTPVSEVLAGLWVAQKSNDGRGSPLVSKKSEKPLVIRPLTGMPVIRDLVVDQTHFFDQYRHIKPWLINDEPPPATERLQSPQERARLDGLYECILCGCCTSGCPSWWWNPDKYLGPAVLLQAQPRYPKLHPGLPQGAQPDEGHQRYPPSAVETGHLRRLVMANLLPMLRFEHVTTMTLVDVNNVPQKRSANPMMQFACRRDQTNVLCATQRLAAHS